MGRLEQEDNVYEGQWKNSRRHGLGSLFLRRDGKLVRVYKGFWANHRRNGYGVQYYRSGEIYEGEWHDNVREGEGTHYFLNGDKYEGEWANDVKCGWGRLIKANGDVFEGQWRYDMREGPGIFFYHSTGHKMEGEWHADVCKFGSMVAMDEKDSETRQLPENELADALGVLRSSKEETEQLRDAAEEEMALRAEEEAMRRELEEYGDYDTMEALMQDPAAGGPSGVHHVGYGSDPEFLEGEEYGSEMGSEGSMDF